MNWASSLKTKVKREALQKVLMTFFLFGFREVSPIVGGGGEIFFGSGLFFEVGFEAGDDIAPPDFAFGDGGGVVKLLFAIEEGEEAVFEL